MRNYRFWIMLLLPLAFIACSSEEPQEPDYPDCEYINFSPEVRFGETGILTRSEIIHDIFPEGASFGVLGYCVPATTSTGNVTLDYASGRATWNNKRPFLCADVFYKQQVTVRGGQCSYNYENTGARRKWYKPGEYGVPEGINTDDYSYSFFAYYPFEDYFTITQPTALKGRGAPMIKFEMPFLPGGTKETSRNHTNVKDAMFTQVYDVTRSTSQVPLLFYHLLTGIRFRINNFDPEQTLTIKSITLEGNFFRSATLDLTRPANEGTQTTNIDDTYRGTFDILGGKEMTCAGNASLITGETDENPEGTTVLLLPNPDADPGVSDGSLHSYYLGSEKYINVTYSFPNGEEKSQRLEVGQLSFQAKRSSRYTANLNFINGQFVLMFTASKDGNWDADFENDIIIN